MSRPSHRREFLKTGAAVGIGYLAGAGILSAGGRTSPAQEAKPAAAPNAKDPNAVKVYIMTDMEGVAGILDSEHWCRLESRYYDLGKEFLTLEVNAAIEGFALAGATEFLVADGHGWGGINPKLLDPRAELARNWAPPPYPFSLERGFHFAAWVGQHAMSRTPFAHIPHTGNMGVFETTINGQPVGEFGEMALCASQLGVRTIFGSGDLAFTKEAQALVPGIETVAVKRGTTPGRGDECDAQAYGKRNLGAIHMQPERARDLIREGARRALQRAKADERLGLVPLKPPYERVTILRAQGEQPKRIGRSSHPEDVIALMNAPLKFETVKK